MKNNITIQLLKDQKVTFQFSDDGLISQVYGGTRIQNIEACNLLNKSAKEDGMMPFDYLSEKTLKISSDIGKAI